MTARDWWAVAVNLVVVIAVSLFTVVYVSGSEQKWCDLLTSLDSPIPPSASNPRAEEIAGKLRILRIDFGC